MTLQKWTKYIQRTEHIEEDTIWVGWKMGTLWKFQDMDIRGWNIYTKSLVNTNLFYMNFTNTHFQKVPIPHLTRTMKQKFLH